MVDNDKEKALKELKEKFLESSELQYALGYATALTDLIKMVRHLKGEDNSSELTIGELVQLIKIATESLPLYQQFKKEFGV